MEWQHTRLAASAARSDSHVSLQEPDFITNEHARHIAMKQSPPTVEEMGENGFPRIARIMPLHSS